MASYSTSLHGLAAPTVQRQLLDASKLPGNRTVLLTYSPPKQTRRNRCGATTAALTASQDAVSLLPIFKQHSALAPASQCALLPQHAAADAATLETGFPRSPAASERQPDVLQVLTQQLAEQHIPFCLPSQPLTPASLPDSCTGHLTPSAAGHYLLNRYLQDVRVCTTPPYPAQAAQHALQQGPAAPERHSVVSSLLQSSSHLHTQLQQVQQPQLDETHALACMSHCMNTVVGASVHSQHQSPSAGLEARWQPAALCHSPHFACIQDMASTMLLDKHSCSSSICQLAEVLRLRSSKGQTWKGLALRQAIMGRALGQCDDEASVQDAAGGGGLLHGGAEDGGEGGGPSRGWGGAAGEDGDAEEDEEEDEEDEDEDQEEDEDEDDSSSEDSQSASDWTSLAQSGGCSMQHMSHLPCDHARISWDSHNSDSQHLHQHPYSKQQPQTADHPNIVHAFACDLGTNGEHAADRKAQAEASLHEQTRYRTACKQDLYYLTQSHMTQQDGVLRHNDLHINRQRSGSPGSSFWKDLPDFAIRLCINVLGSCL